ncbi:hypothetical protein ACFSZS_01970 [Seohaeicola zhoushanensis]
MMKRLGLLLLLAACSEMPASDDNMACLSPREKALVGQPLAIAQAVMPAGTRFIPPGGVITMDYRQDRHNADYDAKGS